MVIRPTSPLRPELRSAAAASRRGRRPNQRLERTGARPVHHGRASVGAGRSTAGRYTDRTESFFSLGFVPHWGFNETSRRVRGFRLKASGSVEHPGGLQPVGVGFVTRGLSSSGERRRRRTGPGAVLGSIELPEWREARAFERVGSRCSRGRSAGAGSFDRRYNIRLHLTAPREHCSHAARGEPV